MLDKLNRKKTALVIILFLAAFLRLWRLSEVPVSLFGDELDVGYHAYSIIKTGRDYYGNFMPLNFHSLAEWRTPLYIYSTIPTVTMFGISPLGVRLPAAFFGILGVWGIYLLTNLLFERKVRHISPGLLSALILAISPWHIQYSRAAFEVTMLLAFLIFGIYFFVKSLKNGKYLWVSVSLLVATPLIYSTAKLFAPILLLLLFLIYIKDIFKLPRRFLFYAVLAGLIVGIPTSYATLYNGGSQRFGYISVFTDPTIEPEVGTDRLDDALVRGDLVLGYAPKLEDRLFHNKITFWTDRITNNYLQAFSTDFLFMNGDPNLRHSPKSMGQFYKVEFLALIIGTVIFFVSKVDKKTKFLIGGWITFAVLPSAITRDGGNHATRLIILLPPLVLLVTYGLVYLFDFVKSRIKLLLTVSYVGVWMLSFIFYQHNYWVHYPWDSERWWHSGFKESIQGIKKIDNDYDRVIISMAGEPAWIFFAAWYEYPPYLWHREFPIGNDVRVNGFGKISHTGKFYFGTVDPKIGLYGLSNIIDNKTLYLANASEIGANLILEPGRTPPGLNLIKAVAYPSGEPAFYLLSKKES